jgi:chromate reductase, NAD(P)H dehydrogenase (quinone)
MQMSSDRCEIRVLVFAASLRQASLNGRLADLAAGFMESRGAAVDRATMAEFDCPSYDQDVESSMPTGAESLRRRLGGVDALVIAAPEYNASMPGVLKNVIDWTSRFRPQPFNGKQAMLLSASPSMVGGNRGLWATRIPLEHLGARVYPDMFSLAQAHEAFGDDGRLANATLQKRFEDTLTCFMDLVEADKHYSRMKKQWVEFLGERPDAAIDRVETTEVHAA